MTTTNDDERPERLAVDRWRLRGTTLVALVLSGLLIVAWWLGTDARPYEHIDHAAFLRTVEYQQDGQGYYEAMRQAFLDIDTTIGHARGYRIPTAFLVWRWIPLDMLYGAFLVGVVATSALLVARLARNPVSIVAVTAYLLVAGRSIDGYEGVGVESWMLVELWLVPLAIGAVVAWRAERDWLSAGLALAATLLRETAAVLLVGGALAAVIGRRTKVPWLVAPAVGAALYGLHFWVASGYADPPGNFAPLFGTGDPPRTVWEMLRWTVFPTWPMVAALWAIGGLGIWRSRERWLLLPLLAMPLNGILVDRPYWGIFLVPFLLTYGIDEVLAPFSRTARSGAAGAEGSTPPPRTRWLGRGTQEAAPAPPSA